MSGREGKSTLAAAWTTVGCTGFLRGVFAGVGSMFAARLSDGCCKEEFLSGLRSGSSNGAPGDGAALSMALASLLRFEDWPLESFLRGELCVEDGGE